MTDDSQIDFKQKIKKPAITAGIVLGIVSVVFSILSFYFITEMTTSFIMISVGPFLFTMLVPLIFIIILLLDVRKKIGGYWTFRQALTGIYLMLVIGTVINFLGYSMLFAKVIEPSMVEKTETAMVNSLSTMLDKSAVDQKTADKSIDDVTKAFEAQKKITPVKILVDFSFKLIMLFILAVILSGIFKKERPVLVYDENYTTTGDPTA